MFGVLSTFLYSQVATPLLEDKLLSTPHLEDQQECMADYFNQRGLNVSFISI
jgi:hypothetical protein